MAQKRCEVYQSKVLEKLYGRIPPADETAPRCTTSNVAKCQKLTDSKGAELMRQCDPAASSLDAAAESGRIKIYGAQGPPTHDVNDQSAPSESSDYAERDSGCANCMRKSPSSDDSSDQAEQVKKLTKNQKRKLKKKRRKAQLKLIPERSKEYVCENVTSENTNEQLSEKKAVVSSFLEGVWELYCKEVTSWKSDSAVFSSLLVSIQEAGPDLTNQLSALQTVLSLGVCGRAEEILTTPDLEEMTHEERSLLGVLSRYWLGSVYGKLLPGGS